MIGVNEAAAGPHRDVFAPTLQQTLVVDVRGDIFVPPRIEQEEGQFYARPCACHRLVREIAREEVIGAVGTRQGEEARRRDPAWPERGAKYGWNEFLAVKGFRRGDLLWQMGGRRCQVFPITHGCLEDGEIDCAAKRLGVAENNLAAGGVAEQTEEAAVGIGVADECDCLCHLPHVLRQRGVAEAGVRGGQQHLVGMAERLEPGDVGDAVEAVIEPAHHPQVRGAAVGWWGMGVEDTLVVQLLAVGVEHFPLRVEVIRGTTLPTQWLRASEYDESSDRLA